MSVYMHGAEVDDRFITDYQVAVIGYGKNRVSHPYFEGIHAVNPSTNMGHILHTSVDVQCLLICTLFFWNGLLCSPLGTKNLLK